ncbi:hypothetical protein T05_6224 [Trichinella murrelli]|uniref:Uncharacterized protein n=1 Tax=Trichinella murrelli TaxID=144512 RepID=A0A0V0UGI7_9BILA|nr:hypothetical protein T05_6224 [Trichinella murrelli]
MLLSLFSAINKIYTDLSQPGNFLFYIKLLTFVYDKALEILTKAEHTAQCKLKLQSYNLLNL